MILITFVLRSGLCGNDFALFVIIWYDCVKKYHPSEIDIRAVLANEYEYLSSFENEYEYEYEYLRKIKNEYDYEYEYIFEYIRL